MRAERMGSGGRGQGRRAPAGVAGLGGGRLVSFTSVGPFVRPALAPAGASPRRSDPLHASRASERQGTVVDVAGWAAQIHAARVGCGSCHT